MTTERAIELLHRLQDEQFDGEYGDERREALSMAVRALSGDGDTIYRKAAIVDVLEGVDWYHINEATGKMVHGSTSDMESWYKVDNVYKAIEALPSTQPEPYWIPVTDRFPETKSDGEIEYLGNGQLKMVDSTFEISEPVFVTRRILDGTRIDVAFWEIEAADREYWVDEYGEILHNVLAWMPLPEPYGGNTK